MTDAIATLSEEIRALLAEPVASDREPLLARLEDTLTEGYARALTLESECFRIERRIGELAAGLHVDGDEKRADELTELGRRLARVERQLAELRALLEPLRDRARAIRVS